MASVVDGASEALAQVRAERRDNLASLRQGMEETARALWQRGVCEAREPNIIRGRFCIGVKVRRRTRTRRRTCLLPARPRAGPGPAGLHP
jgi:hypothetical protein